MVVSGRCWSRLWRVESLLDVGVLCPCLKLALDVSSAVALSVYILIECWISCCFEDSDALDISN